MPHLEASAIQAIIASPTLHTCTAHLVLDAAADSRAFAASLPCDDVASMR